MFIEVRLCDLKTYLNPTSYLKKSSQRRTSIKLCFSSLFRLNWPRIWFYNPIYKKWTFFRFQNSHFNIIWHKICMTFYLLRWTYFNDVNVGRNILTNSQLKRILFMSSDKKKWNKTCERQKKNMGKENNTDESDFSENEIPDSNSLKPFEFAPKTNRDITSSLNQPSEIFCNKRCS